MDIIAEIILPASLIAVTAIIVKPAVFKYLFVKAGEEKIISREVGFRLGQISEFSFLIAVLALESSFIEENTSYLIQLATLITLIVSSYIIVLQFPTPIAVRDKLRRD